MIIGKDKIVDTGVSYLKDVEPNYKILGRAYSTAKKEFEILKKAVSSLRKIDMETFGIVKVKRTLIVSCKSELIIEGEINITLMSETTNKTPIKEEIKRIKKYLSGVEVVTFPKLTDGFYYTKRIPFKVSLVPDKLNQKILDSWNISYNVQGIELVGSLYCGNSQKNPLPQADIDKIETIFQRGKGREQAFEIALSLGVVWTVVAASKYPQAWEDYISDLLFVDDLPF